MISSDRETTRVIRTDRSVTIAKHGFRLTLTLGIQLIELVRPQSYRDTILGAGPGGLVIGLLSRPPPALFDRDLDQT